MEQIPCPYCRTPITLLESPIYSFNDSDHPWKNITCGICLELLREQTIILFKCSHIFCLSCVEEISYHNSSVSIEPEVEPEVELDIFSEILQFNLESYYDNVINIEPETETEYEMVISNTIAMLLDI